MQYQNDLTGMIFPVSKTGHISINDPVHQFLTEQVGEEETRDLENHLRDYHKSGHSGVVHFTENHVLMGIYGIHGEDIRSNEKILEHHLRDLVPHRPENDWTRDRISVYVPSESTDQHMRELVQIGHNTGLNLVLISQEDSPISIMTMYDDYLKKTSEKEEITVNNITIRKGHTKNQKDGEVIHVPNGSSDEYLKDLVQKLHSSSIPSILVSDDHETVERIRDMVLMTRDLIQVN